MSHQSYIIFLSSILLSITMFLGQSGWSQTKNTQSIPQLYQFEADVEPTNACPGGYNSQDPCIIECKLNETKTTHSAIETWKKYFNKYYLGKYKPLTDKRLKAIAHKTFKASSQFGFFITSNCKNLPSLMLLNFKATMLGLSDEYINEAVNYISDLQGSEFGLQWYQYQLNLISDPDNYRPPDYPIK